MKRFKASPFEGVRLLRASETWGGEGDGGGLQELSAFHAWPLFGAMPSAIDECASALRPCVKAKPPKRAGAKRRALTQGRRAERGH